MSAQANNVHHFPADVSALSRIRHCKRMIAKCRHDIETADPYSDDVGERVRASCAPNWLRDWQEMLSEAEKKYALATAGDVIQFGGRMYRAVKSASGAN